MKKEYSKNNNKYISSDICSCIANYAKDYKKMKVLIQYFVK